MSEVQKINCAKKEHLCSWCGLPIEAGSPYKRYRWFDGGDASTVKEHLECYDAMIELSVEEGGDIEFSPGENPRGCNCGFDDNCDRCASIRGNNEKGSA